MIFMYKMRIIEDYQKDGKVVLIKNDFEAVKKTKPEVKAVDLEKTEKKAEEIIQKAKEEARNIERLANEKAKSIIEDANSQSELIKEEAYNIGFEEGKRLGILEGKKEYQELCEKAKEVIGELLEEKYKTLESMEGEIVKLSMVIAQKIIQTELKTNKMALVSVIASALKNAANCEKVMIKVSGEDYEDVIGSKDVLRKQLINVKSFDIVKDEILSSYDCVIETESGTINASVANQVMKLNEVLQESLA